MSIAKPKFLLTSIAFTLLLASCAKIFNQSQPSNNSVDEIQLQYQKWIEMKEAAIPELAAAIKSPHWKIRSHSLLAIGQSGNKTLVPDIIKMLESDEILAVRNCAAIALGDLKAQEGVSHLIKLVRRDVSIPKNRLIDRRIAIESLGKIKDSSAISVLIDVILDGAEAEKFSAVEALVSINNKKASELLLSKRSQLKKHNSDQFAAMLFGDVPIAGSTEYLLEMAKSNDVQLQIVSAVSLGKLKERRAVTQLVKNIKSTETLLQKQSINALISINDSSSIIPLLSLFSDQDEKVYMAAAYTLANMNAAGLTEKVFEAMRKSTKINAPAAYVLGRKKYSASGPLLKQRLVDVKQTGHLEMAEALGWMGDRTAIPLLIDVATRPNKNGSIGAIRALGILKATESVPYLITILAQNDDEMIAESISALGNIGDARAIKPIINIVNTYGTRYAIQSGIALGRIAGPEVKDFVINNINSDDKARVIAAGSAMVKLRDAEMIPLALKVLYNDDPIAAKYVVKFLQKTTGYDYRTIQEWKQWGEKR